MNTGQTKIIKINKVFFSLLVISSYPINFAKEKNVNRKLRKKLKVNGQKMDVNDPFEINPKNNQVIGIFKCKFFHFTPYSS